MHVGGLGVGSTWMEKGKSKERRGEVQIPAVLASANGRVQMAWRERAFDWGTKRHLWTTKSNSHKCTDTLMHTYTHTKLCGVLFVLARPLAPNTGGMFDCPPLAPFETWCHPNKMPSFQREPAFYAFRAAQWKERGGKERGERHGGRRKILRKKGR